MLNRISMFACAFMLGCGMANAQTPQQQPQPSPDAVLKSLDFKSGTVTLGDNLAQLKLGEKFRYLDPADTEKFLVQVWHNPPDAAKGTLGMIVPITDSALEDWAVVVTYDDSGYVKDEDAGKLNYDDIMKDMQSSVAQANEGRVAQGYERLQLLGWARKPYYDAAAKKMYWAKRLKFGDEKEETLNYEIRILGRGGVLELNAVASMSALASIDQRVNPVLAMVDFTKGNTYAEFDPKVDKVAAYGLAGLIAGGVLAKAGFFKVLIGLLIAGKKFLLLGALAAGGVISRYWKRLTGRKDNVQPAAASGDAPQA